MTPEQQVVAERKLAELERYLPAHWELVDRASARDEILKPNGSIYCYIHHDERGLLVARLSSAFCAEVARTMRKLINP